MFTTRRKIQRLVPWIAGGRHRLALVTDADLGQAYLRACVAPELEDYESFNICGTEFPSTREVIDLVAREGGLPRPWFSVPRWAAYAFGWLMEAGPQYLISPIFMRVADSILALPAPDPQRSASREQAHVAVNRDVAVDNRARRHAERAPTGRRLPTATWTAARKLLQVQAGAPAHTIHSATAGFGPSAFRVRIRNGCG